MALMYPWATKEYLLWKMSLPQIIMYHTMGADIKYPKPKEETASLKNSSYEDLKKLKDDLRQKYGAVE